MRPQLGAAGSVVLRREGRGRRSASVVSTARASSSSIARRTRGAPRRRHPPSRPGAVSTSRRRPCRRAGPRRWPRASSSPCSWVSSGTSAGDLRQRASGRRRSAPSPVHGASTRMRSYAAVAGAHAAVLLRHRYLAGERPRSPAARVRRARARPRSPRARAPCAQRLGGEHRGLAARARRTGRASARPRRTGSARVSASAASCEPSSCTRRRPPDSRTRPSGSPPPRRKPNGEYGVCRASSGTSASPGSAAIVTRGDALSAVSSASSSSARPSARQGPPEGPDDPHRVREHQPEPLVVRARARRDTRAIHSPGVSREMRRSTAFANPAAPRLPALRASSTDSFTAACEATRVDSS